MKKLFVLIIAFTTLSVSSFAQKGVKKTKVKTEKKEVKAGETKVEKKETVKTPEKKVEKKETVKVSGPVKKDGTPDMRYKANHHLKKDGTPDMRYKENKKH